MFEAQVVRTPDAVAVIAGERRITYGELEARANQLAHALRARGVERESVVGVRCAPSIEQVVAVLGVLKAGGAYLPLDPDEPAQRAARIVADAGARIVVSDVEAGDQPTTRPEVEVALDDAIYVLATSGSTGVPKGVVGVHRAIVNRLEWQQAVYPYEAGEIVCARTPLGFVDSVAEVFAPLAFGVPLVMIDAVARRDPSLMIERLVGVTRIVVVPSLLATLLDVCPDLAVRVPALRYWFVGGEPVPPPLVERFQRALPGCKLINIYGSTEVSGDATYFDFDRMPPGLASSPIGIPLSGVHVRLLDEDLREVDVGEVCVSGVCLARGYLHGADARFVGNPFPEGGRLYRMGDIARRLPSGDFQYLGRADQLVKIRGMRVELGEVEAGLLAVPGVVHVAVLARADRQGSRSLVAFYTGTARPADVRAQLRLPSHMIPSQLVVLDALPRTSSGKIDRRALADREIAVPASAPPATELERRVARAWEQVLERAPIGRLHDFHELGGTSLSAVRIVARLRDELGLSIPLAAIFEHPTVAGLAAHLDGLGAAARRLPIAPTERPLPASLPLTHYQYPFWLFRALTGDVSIVSEVFAFAHTVDVERLQRAFAATVTAFDTLWMRFPRWRPVQQLAPRHACRFEVRDARVLAEETAANNSRLFALTRPPHVHARLVRLASGARLLVAMPHICVDMAALELFRVRLEQHYLGTPITEPTGASLLDVIDWERAPHDTSDDERYWRALIGTTAWNPVRVSRGAGRALGRRELGEPPRANLAVALVAAIGDAVCSELALDEITLLLMIDKRDRAELRSLFTTMTALMPVRVHRGMSLAALRDQLLASYEHTDHLMRVPTMWNDAWPRSPLRSRGARYLRALAPRRGLLVCVNILPEVFDPEPVEISRRRTIDHVLRPGDIVPGSDALLDRTLQIHVTREPAGTVVNLYGGGFDQRGLDAIAARIALAAPAAAVG
jgi:amino acid adenylation domain-containing protein